MKTTCFALFLSLAAFSATAQTAPAFTSTCHERNSSGSNKHFCETRDLNMAAPAASGTLTIDGRANGGITVRGWDGSEVRVRAIVTTWAKSEQEARQRASAISISTKNDKLRAEGPSSPLGDNWAVSYEVLVPRQTAVAMNTVNGGISIDGMQSNIKFDAVNGGVSLANVGGYVKGSTTNGGLHIKLAGAKWEGKGLDVATTNGGITWELPKNYSARLYTSTNMGGISGDLPVTKTGMMSKEVTASLGQGGAPVKAVTTNGGIKVNQQ
ncbi:hypothetical protein PK28_12440 [Hymenobacter sp. DG25B]|uniref:DUF4097 family beta strand repeat-containing protein n=1 Tax=Hymenobacter sp. DG25B TaxID=1385664 RepID=UPI0005408AEB|nr:DUF4097 family beta strand repeat-containing protein [Hymenobacter sp. DG25B]AIZ64288.1 hypothetical protein PK28_12440 [Hymenobacter sp. DG25B]